MEEEQMQCTLTGSDLAVRVGEWAALASQATSRKSLEGKIVSTYPASPEILARLKGLIEAEAQCCEFLEFEVREHPEEIVVELQVPSGMKDAFETLFGTVMVQQDSLRKAEGDF